MLQQYLPFTVLKHIAFCDFKPAITLQQYLPFTVLKQAKEHEVPEDMLSVATVLTVYGIET